MTDNTVKKGSEQAVSANKGVLFHIATGFIVLALCVGIILVAMIKPYDKLKVYLNIAFMDDFKNTPDGAGNGLIIKDNEIKDEHSGETSDSGEFIRPKYGERYAMIKTGALSVDVPVYWGSDVELFERGACQSTGSVLAGAQGNTVISAHEDTFFNELDKISIGDKVTINTNYGEFIYTVKEKIAFNKKENKYVSPTKDDRLTLYTCKKNVFGSSDERIGVICELTEKKFYTPLKEDK